MGQHYSARAIGEGLIKLKRQTGQSGGADRGVLLPELRGPARTPVLLVPHGLSGSHAGGAGLGTSLGDSLMPSSSPPPANLASPSKPGVLNGNRTTTLAPIKREEEQESKTGRPDDDDDDDEEEGFDLAR